VVKLLHSCTSLKPFAVRTAYRAPPFAIWGAWSEGAWWGGDASQIVVQKHLKGFQRKETIEYVWILPRGLKTHEEVANLSSSCQKRLHNEHLNNKTTPVQEKYTRVAITRNIGYRSTFAQCSPNKNNSCSDRETLR